MIENYDSSLEKNCLCWAVKKPSNTQENSRTLEIADIATVQMHMQIQILFMGNWSTSNKKRKGKKHQYNGQASFSTRVISNAIMHLQSKQHLLKQTVISISICRVNDNSMSILPFEKSAAPLARIVKICK